MLADSKKVLLMGARGSGKTSMRSIIFANYIPSDTNRLGSTVNIENSAVRFLGNLVLNIWDCGGQEKFFEDYFTSQREHIFSNVEVLLYIFDITSETNEIDLEFYQETLRAIHEYSRDAKIFCLVHKMDLVKAYEPDDLFKAKRAQLKSLTLPLKMVAFPTSIWDETLYKAWSCIVHSLIPNAQLLENDLNKFCSISEVNEIVLFERVGKFFFYNI
eukprot:TRINITY_DN1877_c0_g1_i8.p1 TRINITY_DN1877_c0_g1~~TRINITY_DN1877_c0_g1_i8.p1  ORF type:complete len:216 (+),score=32.46 TRINITY_DN1877_c0_g1_i8:74-721(+)